MSMTVHEMEDAIVRAAIEGLIETGYLVSYHDGGGFAVLATTDVDRLMREVRSTDEAYLYARRPSDKKWVGEVFLVYGNDGFDVIADHTINLDHALRKAEQLSEDFSNGVFH